MLNRWIGITCALLMLAGNSALFFKEIYPKMTSGDPPPVDALSLRPEDGPRVTQVGIFLADGRRVGSSFTTAVRPGVATLVQSVTVLESIPLPQGLHTPRVRFDMDLSYGNERDVVDSFRASIHGLGIPISITGEFTPPDDLPCKWTLGSQTGTFIVPASSTRAIGDAIRPFNRLPGLYEGQWWRVKLFDPVAHILPQLGAGEVDFESIIVRVTRREAIEHRGDWIDAHVVEAPNATAWVAPDGRVIKQEVTLPVFGKLVLIDEPYDPVAHKTANSTVFAGDVDAQTNRRVPAHWGDE